MYFKQLFFQKGNIPVITCKIPQYYGKEERENNEKLLIVNRIWDFEDGEIFGNL